MAETNVLSVEVVRARPLLKVPEPSSSRPTAFGTVASVAAAVRGGLLTSHRLPGNLWETDSTRAVALPARYCLDARLLAESEQGGTGHTHHGATQALAFLNDTLQLHGSAAALAIDHDAKSLLDEHAHLVHGLADVLAEEGLRRGILPTNRPMSVSRFVDPEEDRQELVVTQYVNLPTQEALAYWDELGDAIERWSRSLSPEDKVVLNSVIAINVKGVQ